MIAIMTHFISLYICSLYRYKFVILVFVPDPPLCWTNKWIEWKTSKILFNFFVIFKLYQTNRKKRGRLYRNIRINSQKWCQLIHGILQQCQTSHDMLTDDISTKPKIQTTTTTLFKSYITMCQGILIKLKWISNQIHFMFFPWKTPVELTCSCRDPNKEWKRFTSSPSSNPAVMSRTSPSLVWLSSEDCNQEKGYLRFICC